MIRNHDPAVVQALELIRSNKNAYVVPEALEMATAIVEMDEDMKYLRHEYGRMMPIVAAFRQWRGGHRSTESLLEFFNSDEAGKALSLEDWAWKRENDAKCDAKWLALREGKRPPYDF